MLNWKFFELDKHEIKLYAFLIWHTVTFTESATLLLFD